MKKLLLFFLLFIVFSSPVYTDENWTKVAPNNYVDYDAVIGLQDRYGFSFLLKAYNKGQYESINSRQVLYTLSQYEMDCSKRTYKIGLIDSYDEEDVFLNGDYNKYAEFQPIVAGTAVSAIYSKLCRP